MIRQEQCDKVCRILDDVLANRSTERDSLIVAVRKAFNALEQAKTNCSEFPNSSDIISRQAAIDALCKSECGWNNAECRHKDGTDFYVTCDNVKIIKSLPSAQPECPKGRWIPTASEKGRHECSRCHEYAPCYQDGSEHLSTFCVLCGAKMEEGK